MSAEPVRIEGWAVARLITGLELTDESKQRLDAAALHGTERMEVDIQCSSDSACYTSLERVDAE